MVFRTTGANLGMDEGRRKGDIAKKSFLQIVTFFDHRTGKERRFKMSPGRNSGPAEKAGPSARSYFLTGTAVATACCQSPQRLKN